MVGKVLARGQVTLPKEVRRAARVRPGDMVAFEVLGPGKIELRVLSRMRLAEALERYKIDSPVDEPADRAAWQERAAEDAMGPAEPGKRRAGHSSSWYARAVVARGRLGPMPCDQLAETDHDELTAMHAFLSSLR